MTAKVGHQAKPPTPEKEETIAPAKQAAPAGATSTPTKDPEGTTNMELEPGIVTPGSPQKTAKQDREAEEASPNNIIGQEDLCRGVGKCISCHESANIVC